MGDVSPEPEHDAGVASADAQHALSAGAGASGSPAGRVAIALGTLILCAGFIALGTWQMHRRTWKLALIARVEQRVHADPVAPPPRADWPQVSAARDEYRHVRIAGTWLPGRDTRVHAATALGSGYWVMTPLAAADGSIVLINRGFVPAEAPSFAPGGATAGLPSVARSAKEGEVTVTGLLRMTEPGGAFLRRNDPATGRWYSRDVAAIAAARGLSEVAPYFIDAEAPPAWRGKSRPDPRSQEPVAGLTLVTFDNNHLIYAITWYALALMVAVRTVRAVERLSSETRP